MTDLWPFEDTVLTLSADFKRAVFEGSLLDVSSFFSQFEMYITVWLCCVAFDQICAKFHVCCTASENDVRINTNIIFCTAQTKTCMQISCTLQINTRIQTYCKAQTDTHIQTYCTAQTDIHLSANCTLQIGNCKQIYCTK